MKPVIWKILLVSFVLSFISSCSEEKEWKDIDELIVPLYVTDGAVISGINFYCIQFNYGDIYKLGFSTQEEYYRSIKTVDNWSDFFFLFDVDCYRKPLHLTNKDEDEILQAQMWQYLEDKRDFIRQDKDSHVNDAINPPLYFTSFIDGEVEITCDKTLFGLAPGKNLTEYLQIIQNYGCQPFGIQPPYGCIHKNQLNAAAINTVFNDQAWLRNEYRLKFLTSPDERYDEVTFHFKFPLITEFVSSYVASLMKGYDFHQRYEKVVYESDITVRFK